MDLTCKLSFASVVLLLFVFKYEKKNRTRTICWVQR